MTKLTAICWTLVLITRLLSAASGAPAPGWDSYFVVCIATVMYAWRIDRGI